ncbi:glucosylglycerol hydrolase [Chromatocurvus halotolerans]|uniref:Putative glycoside hydrolase-like family 5 (GHL5) protein n=1 Tax=Chromatocurvus halotolerans TaxID=1132028 RepID=A0A4R2KJR4_9GAMM|nr:glucosylglycerol hydrolase [Chromatocurvus halotolerans]TCO72772.1 putative glycoside hydrolase-like family 5 (GHL5) protein [Chromatocurvus halotolerans]
MSLCDRVAVDAKASEALVAWCRERYLSLPTSFDAERAIARYLGAHVSGDSATFGFWTPELLDHRVPEGDVFLEILSPLAPIDLTRSHQEIDFERVYLPVRRYEAHTFAVATGLRAGRRDRIGDFYALVWRDCDDQWQRILDPLAASLPFGAFAPAELYDLDAMQAARTDRDYYAARRNSEPHKFGPPTNILQIHVPTGTAGGTLASLARQFERLGERLRNNLPTEDSDAVYLGYDAVQLLPVEPTTVYETGPDFWHEHDRGDGRVSVTLMRPDTTNWGYDVVISGMATVNPVLLESGRPDELVDLAAVLHNFPEKPKMLILDVVYGHADNQGLKALNHHYFAGPNMYGQNLEYRNPAVRAILLEMQRRKVNFGADGVRVDGAQDFKWWDNSTQQLRHDDDYLQLMADIEQEVAGLRYRPWFIFEDGRPWPNEDWELSSSYRSVIEHQRDNDVFQWGPLTFAHNTPFLYTFWLSKYWRIKEILAHGDRWISGTANHDTLRRGTQVNPKLNVNTRLGSTRMDILDKAYDNPSVGLLTYAVLPGVPMDFLNASARASWGFIRNQDDQYGVKVVAEEAISLKWQVDDYAYSIPANFQRLKALGFETREELVRFMEFLPALVEVTDYALGEIASLLSAVEPPLAGPAPVTPAALKEVARAWMDDMHEYCNVVHSLATLDSAQANFMFSLRRFRRANPWLRDTLMAKDYFDYLQPINGRTVFAAVRHAPDGRQYFTLTHMEGDAAESLDPLSLPIPQLAGDGWELLLRTPSIDADYRGGEIVLHDSMGLMFTRASD